MRTTCCRPSPADPEDRRPCLRTLAARAALCALIAVAPPAPARAQGATVACALQPGPVQVQGATLRLELAVDCTPGVADARPLPRDADLLVGLTLYGHPREPAALRSREPNYRGRTLQAPAAVGAALGSGVVSRNVQVAGRPRWTVLDDRDAPSHDAQLVPLRIRRAGERLRVAFTLPAADAGDRPHLLFAVWPQAARENCDRSAPDARSGCKRDGVVLEGDPLIAYPGREIAHFSHPSGDWDAERWIVERFR